MRVVCGLLIDVDRDAVKVGDSGHDPSSRGGREEVIPVVAVQHQPHGFGTSVPLFFVTPDHRETVASNTGSREKPRIEPSGRRFVRRPRHVQFAFSAVGERDPQTKPLSSFYRHQARYLNDPLLVAQPVDSGLLPCLRTDCCICHTSSARCSDGRRQPMYKNHL